jgi:hypothetical protein
MSDRPPPSSPAFPAVDEATMMFQAPDPGLDRLKGALSAENLRAMQTALARCEVEHIAPGSAFEGFNFRGFVRNLRGIGKLEIGGTRIYTLLTRNNAFLLSNLVAEELHDLIQGFMGLDLRDRATLRDGDKRRFLYKIESRQLERLRTIVNENRMLTAHAFAFADLGQFRQRLASCVVPVGDFDIVAFAATVHAVSNLYLDAHHQQYHQLYAGDPPQPYQLFVAPQAEYADAQKLMYGSTPLALLRD